MHDVSVSNTQDSAQQCPRFVELRPFFNSTVGLKLEPLEQRLGPAPITSETEVVVVEASVDLKEEIKVVESAQPLEFTAILAPTLEPSSTREVEADIEPAVTTELTDETDEKRLEVESAAQEPESTTSSPFQYSDVEQRIEQERAQHLKELSHQQAPEEEARENNKVEQTPLSELTGASAEDLKDSSVLTETQVNNSEANISDNNISEDNNSEVNRSDDNQSLSIIFEETRTQIKSSKDTICTLVPFEHAKAFLDLTISSSLPSFVATWKSVLDYSAKIWNSYSLDQYKISLPKFTRGITDFRSMVVCGFNITWQLVADIKKNLERATSTESPVSVFQRLVLKSLNIDSSQLSVLQLDVLQLEKLFAETLHVETTALVRVSILVVIAVHITAFLVCWRYCLRHIISWIWRAVVFSAYAVYGLAIFSAYAVYGLAIFSAHAVYGLAHAVYGLAIFCKRRASAIGSSVLTRSTPQASAAPAAAGLGPDARPAAPAAKSSSRAIPAYTSTSRNRRSKQKRRAEKAEQEKAKASPFSTPERPGLPRVTSWPGRWYTSQDTGSAGSADLRQSVATSPMRPGANWEEIMAKFEALKEDKEILFSPKVITSLLDELHLVADPDNLKQGTISSAQYQQCLDQHQKWFTDNTAKFKELLSTVENVFSIYEFEQTTEKFGEKRKERKSTLDFRKLEKKKQLLQQISQSLNAYRSVPKEYLSFLEINLEGETPGFDRNYYSQEDIESLLTQDLNGATSKSNNIVDCAVHAIAECFAAVCYLRGIHQSLLLSSKICQLMCETPDVDQQVKEQWKLTAQKNVILQLRESKIRLMTLITNLRKAFGAIIQDQLTATAKYDMINAALSEAYNSLDEKLSSDEEYLRSGMKELDAIGKR